jgi:hypothetical protein
VLGHKREFSTEANEVNEVLIFVTFVAFCGDDLLRFE